METYFIYNGKTYSTPNLTKKLKRLGITESDIQIIDKPIKEDDNTPEWKLKGLRKYRWINDDGTYIVGFTKQEIPPCPNDKCKLEWL